MLEKVKIYTTEWCGDCLIAKKYLSKLKVPFEEINIEEDQEAAKFVMAVNGGRRSVPTLVYKGSSTSLSGFSRAKLDKFLSTHDIPRANSSS